MLLRRRTFAGLALSTLLAATACGGDGTAPVAVASVAITPASPSVAPGATIALNATVTDAQGHAMSGQSVAWSSNNTAAATITPAGVVTGVAEGTATISAVSGGQTGTTPVVVKYPVPAVAGTYAISGTFDTPAAGFTGTLTLVQADRTGPLTGTMNVTYTGGVSGTNAGPITNASVSGAGAVAFTRANSADGSTWVFTGTATTNAIAGRHSLTTTAGGVTQTFVGPWSATK